MCPHVKFRSQSTQHKQIVNTALKGNSALQHSWKTNSVSGRKTYAIRKLRVDKSTKGREKKQTWHYGYQTGQLHKQTLC